MVVGARFATIGGNIGQGAAYVFVKPGGGLAGNLGQNAKLTASDGAANDQFGDNSIAFNGNTLVVGTPGATIGGNSQQGAAYVFVSPQGPTLAAGQTITTVAGGGIAGLGDGGPATSAGLSRPSGVALDASGNLLIADSLNSLVRKVDARTGIITTVAGTGVAGFSGDGGAATGAQLLSPGGVAVDANGNLFIADSFNRRIRKVDLSGIITFTVSPPTARPGDSVTITLDTRPSGDATPLDLYAAIGLPSGQFLFWTGDLSSPFSAAPTALRRNMVPSAQTFSIFSDTLPMSVPLGEYSLLAGFVRASQPPAITNVVGNLARGSLVVTTPAPPPLNVSGTWSLTAQVTYSACANPSTTFTTTQSGNVVLTQVGSSVSGAGTLVVEGSGQTSPFTLTGTLVGSQFSGSFRSQDPATGLAVTGTFTGSASDSLLSATVSGQSTVSGVCVAVSGSLTATPTLPPS